MKRQFLSVPADLFIPLLLLALTLAVYWQTGNHAFVTYDDEDYILTNQLLRTGFTTDNLIRLFTSGITSNWHPATWLLHMLNIRLFGMEPAGHHYVNLALHCCNVLLLFFLLRSLTDAAWRSAAVAALFALHPVNVESVAWAAQLKTPLSTLLLFITLALYARYARTGAQRFYCWSLAAFTAGLMSKQMLVSVPLLLLLLDYWPLRRLRSAGGSPGPVPPSVWRPLFLEKAPYIIIAAAAAVIAVISQEQAITPLIDSPLAERIANASVSYVRYIKHIFMPDRLAVFYPFPGSIPLWQPVIAAAFLAAVTLVTVRQRDRRPELLVGWLWFLVSLIPVIGIVRIGLQSMADRYAYVPAIGIFMMAVWPLAGLAGTCRPMRALVSGAAVVCIMVLAVAAWRQAGYWRDSGTLFRHALEVTDGNYIALCGVGRVMEQEGRIGEALAAFEKAVELAPWYSYARTHRDLLRKSRGKLDATVFRYSEAILQNPEAAQGHVNLGIIMAMQGSLDEALKNFTIALDFDPRSAAAHYNMALTLYRKGESGKAVDHYRRALDSNPADHECHNNLGLALLAIGRHQDSIRHFREALRLRPDFRNAQTNLELALRNR